MKKINKVFSIIILMICLIFWILAFIFQSSLSTHNLDFTFVRLSVPFVIISYLFLRSLLGVANNFCSKSIKYFLHNKRKIFFTIFSIIMVALQFHLKSRINFIENKNYYLEDERFSHLKNIETENTYLKRFLATGFYFLRNIPLGEVNNKILNAYSYNFNYLLRSQVFKSYVAQTQLKNTCKYFEGGYSALPNCILKMHELLNLNANFNISNIMINQSIINMAIDSFENILIKENTSPEIAEYLSNGLRLKVKIMSIYQMNYIGSHHYGKNQIYYKIDSLNREKFFKSALIEVKNLSKQLDEFEFNNEYNIRRGLFSYDRVVHIYSAKEMKDSVFELHSSGKLSKQDINKISKELRDLTKNSLGMNMVFFIASIIRSNQKII